MQKIIALYHKYREYILYLFFGGVTTLINFILFLLLSHWLEGPVGLSIANWGSWLVAVVVAYLTNRRWVFQSKAQGSSAQLREFLSFLGSRIFSGLLDYAIVLVAVAVIGLPEIPVKLVSLVLVVVLNYILSRLLVFRTPAPTKDE